MLVVCVAVDRPKIIFPVPAVPPIVITPVVCVVWKLDADPADPVKFKPPVKFRPTMVGPVDKTTDPVPVALVKSVNPDSQSAAVVSVVPIQVHITVVPGMTVITKLPPELFTVNEPVELLQM